MINHNTITIAPSSTLPTVNTAEPSTNHTVDNNSSTQSQQSQQQRPLKYKKKQTAQTDKFLELPPNKPYTITINRPKPVPESDYNY
jgi:hypothetical protein